MTEEELWDALLGLMAYDLGATDSGIHDENLRARVKAELVRLDTEAEARARARREAGDRYATCQAFATFERMRSHSLVIAPPGNHLGGASLCLFRCMMDI